jgi:arylsulfatase A-like enzyme
MIFVAAVTLVSMMPITARADERRPNVVFFLVDDLGWRDLGCYGSSFYETPNIDRFAEQGVSFTQAYATCHVCSPTRASIMTGKYPARLQLTDWLPGRREFPFQKLKNAEIHQHLPLEEITIAEALKAHGYRTAHIGKWHLGEEPFGPLHQGFAMEQGLAQIRLPRPVQVGWPRQRKGRVSDRPADR